MSFGDIAFSLILTAGAYCIIPLMVANFWKKPLSKKKYGVICFIGEAVIAIVFQYWRTSTGASGNSFSPAILWGLVFYNVGLAVLRKRGMLMEAKSKTAQPTAPTAQSAAPQSPAEPEAVSAPAPEPIPAPEPQTAPAQPSSLPITETWYTCPACGCLLPTGEACACGYHPPRVDPPKAPTKKQKWPVVAVAVLAVALACSVFYNVAQADTNAQLSSDLSSAQLQVTAKQATINNYQGIITSLREYNKYLQEDVEYMCGVSSDFDASKLRHSVRSRNPFLR